MTHARLHDWNGLIRRGELHRSNVSHARRTLSDWNAKRYSADLIDFHFLVVDDQRARRGIVTEALRTFAIRNIQEAADVEEGLSLLGRGRIDLALVSMDLRPGGAPGFARLVRTTDRAIDPELPLIGVSPDPFVFAANEAFGAGIDDLVVAPLSPLAFLEVVRRAMRIAGRV